MKKSILLTALYVIGYLNSFAQIVDFNLLKWETKPVYTEITGFAENKKPKSIYTAMKTTSNGRYEQNIGNVALAGISWVQWHEEPFYDGVIGYADNPYDKPTYSAVKASEDWQYENISDAASFDAIWNSLGDSMPVNKPTDTNGGDLFDLENGNSTFGLLWKAMHDDSKLYVFFKYFDKNNESAEDTRFIEVLTQPVYPYRHEPTFQAASDSSEILRVTYQNMAYARYIELGGGKVYFKDGIVTEFSASHGRNAVNRKNFNGETYYCGTWAQNDHGMESLTSENHFWQTDAHGTIRAVLIMPFDGPLAYPAIPTDMDGEYIPTEPGATISFDVKSAAKIGESQERTEYFWSADRNNGYASIYYSGYLALEDDRPTTNQPQVYYCFGETASPLQAEGENLKWYTSPDASPLSEAPVPNTSQEGTTSYYVTQTIDSIESDMREIKVTVHNIDVHVEDLTVPCGDSVTLTGKVTQNYRNEVVTYQWTINQQTYNEKSVTINPNENELYQLTATTPGGCEDTDNALIERSAAEHSYTMARVTNDASTGNNVMDIRLTNAETFDSVFIYRRKADLQEQFKMIATLNADNEDLSYTDASAKTWNEAYEYQIQILDVCGFPGNPDLIPPNHKSMLLSGSRVNKNTVLIQWLPYEGRNVSEYQIYRATGEGDLNKIYSTSTDYNYNDIFTTSEKLSYQVKAIFSNDYQPDELNTSWSNLIRISTDFNAVTDTIFIYDTVRISVTDTLIIDVPFAGINVNQYASVKVFPNPTKEFLHIMAGDLRNIDGYVIRISNTAGEEIYREPVTETLTTIQLSKFGKTGLYFIEIINDEGLRLDVRKIVLE